MTSNTGEHCAKRVSVCLQSAPISITDNLLTMLIFVGVEGHLEHSDQSLDIDINWHKAECELHFIPCHSHVDSRQCCLAFSPPTEVDQKGFRKSSVNSNGEGKRFLLGIDETDAAVVVRQGTQHRHDDIPSA